MKGIPVAARCLLTADERRARKVAADERYRVAARDALHAESETIKA